MKTRFIIGKIYKIGRHIGVFAGLNKDIPTNAQFIIKKPHPYGEVGGYVVFNINDIERMSEVAEIKPEPEDLHETQKQRILEYLKTGKSITKLEALKMFGCWNSGDIIFKLRREHTIETTMITNGKKRFASYKLIENGKEN